MNPSRPRSLHVARFLLLGVLGLLAAPLGLALGCSRSTVAAPVAPDPLPSWNDGAVKSALITYVVHATTAGTADFIPLAERIATFDNDGTLWPEKPIYIQAAFVLARVKQMAAKDPSLKAKQPYKAALTGDVAYFHEAGERAVMELLATTSTGMTEEQFLSEVQDFFGRAKHPKFGVPYTALAYRPMVELLGYLRANGFETHLCSGGGADFMRVVSQTMYGIPAQQVIGTSIETELAFDGGRAVLMRKPELSGVINDKAGKPVGIELHIGKRPVFAAGNVRSGGDIEMLQYTQGNRHRSFQLVIDHDDPVREFAYQEKDGATLSAAHEHGWTVVSMKRDWRTIFAQQVAPATPPVR